MRMRMLMKDSVKSRRKRLVVRYLVVLLLFVPTLMSAQISINVKQQPLKNIIKLIESKSGYRFFYNENLQGLDQLCTLKIDNGSIEKTMSELLSKSTIGYKMENGNLVILYQKEAIDPAKKAVNKITGTVKDEKGQALIGVNILVKGKGIGSITDIDGRYGVEAASGDMLQFTYVGYTTQELKVGTSSSISVTLQENTKALNEVVVVGYGTMKKSDLTGSVSSISSDHFQIGSGLTPQ